MKHAEWRTDIAIIRSFYALCAQRTDDSWRANQFALNVFTATATEVCIKTPHSPPIRLLRLNRQLEIFPGRVKTVSVNTW